MLHVSRVLHRLFPGVHGQHRVVDVAAENDPLVPASMFAGVASSSAETSCSVVSLQLIAGGGHLGFISNGRQDADRRWLDWRLVEWIRAAGTQSGQTTPRVENNLATG